MSDTRDTKLTIQVSDLEKKQVEVIAETYDCSQAAAGRMLFSNAYTDLFGEIHPEALERHDVDLDALVRGEIEPDEIDDDLKMDTDRSPKVPAADGGLSVSMSPSSHSPTHTPQDLATSGTALSWDELKTAVDRHWSDELEIHPDRVEPVVLKNNRDVVSKILAGILRSEQDYIVDALIETRIKDYLENQVRRADKEAGLEFKIEQYKPLIIDHLEAHPGTRTESYYASPNAVEQDLPSFVENTLESLQENQHVLDVEDWASEKGIPTRQIKGKEIEMWLEELSGFRHDLLELERVRKDPTFIDVIMGSDDVDYPEDAYDDPIQWLKSVCESWTGQYTEIEPRARYAAVHTVRDSDQELLDENIDRPDEAVSAFEDEDAPDGKQLAEIVKRVAQP